MPAATLKRIILNQIEVPNSQEENPLYHSTSLIDPIERVGESLLRHLRGVPHQQQSVHIIDFDSVNNAFEQWIELIRIGRRERNSWLRDAQDF